MSRNKLNLYIQILPKALNGNVDGSIPCFTSPLLTRRWVKMMPPQAMYAAEPPTEVMYAKTWPAVTFKFMRARNPQQTEVRDRHVRNCIVSGLTRFARVMESNSYLLSLK
jgi:hypothetical protein